ncbi:hypothetical protein DAPPUDRAFT_247331 [Daphnia pulex]|uniref:Uncharacterized protein n=1 Tax=Daphnia pulex TaxID=6669 RepID=E9GS90_DAPPU|nr:hypothetical protein DAPPUDRAFT_247331 [Daphnia pulex]|eukprot:EFX77671.1 hypothetical protein DAPPUDRAFT_247331 [Daphnia pulex]
MLFWKEPRTQLVKVQIADSLLLKLVFASALRPLEQALRSILGSPSTPYHFGSKSSQLPLGRRIGKSARKDSGNVKFSIDAASHGQWNGRTTTMGYSVLYWAKIGFRVSDGGSEVQGRNAPKIMRVRGDRKPNLFQCDRSVKTTEPSCPTFNVEPFLRTSATFPLQLPMALDSSELRSPSAGTEPPSYSQSHRTSSDFLRIIMNKSIQLRSSFENFVPESHQSEEVNVLEILGFASIALTSDPFQSPAEGKAHPSQATTTCTCLCLWKGTPIPSNVNLKKERAVRLSFTFEGHGDHYEKLLIQWCRGWVRKEREKARDISRVSISDTATTAVPYPSPSAFFTVLPVRIHGKHMASCCCCVLYLMAGSTTGVPMSSWYGVTKPQRRRLTTQKQLTQRPVTASRSTSTTLLSHRSFIPQLTLPRATTLTP